MNSSGDGFSMPLSREARALERSMMRDLIALTARPGIVSFAGGLPAPELFPLAQWTECLVATLRDAGPAALQYGPPFPPLLEAVAQLMDSRGAAVAPNQVLITTGAQQGLHIAARLLVDPGAASLVDRFVFPGVRQAFGGSERRLIEVDAAPGGGVDTNAAAEVVASTPDLRAWVVVPDFHNPLGSRLTAAQRAAVTSLAARVPVVEDDPYGFLDFAGQPRRPLVADAPERTIYLGSFSKVIAPGLRMGWVVAPAPLIEKLRVLKESVDLESSALTQRALARFLAAGYLEPHLAMVRRAYHSRAEAMVRALERHFPPGSRWSTPEGGMFLWVELPAGYDTLAHLRTALDGGVAYVPGAAFASAPAPTTMRLNFSNATVENIESGIARLARSLASARADQPAPTSVGSVT
jgi:2-aminoadipate transaminase